MQHLFLLIFQNEANRIGISLWNHWLSREEYDAEFPVNGSEPYKIACEKLYLCFKEIIELREGIFYELNESMLMRTNSENILKENVIYNPDTESKWYVDEGENFGIYLGYDFCINLHIFEAALREQIFGIVEKYNLYLITHS